MNTPTCRICNGNLTEKITVKEMQFGTRETFEYGICSTCGCLQITDVPADLAKYYPAYYAPFNLKAPVLKPLPPVKRLVKNIRLQRKYKDGSNPILNYFAPMNTRANAKILDIGCGNGVLICKLYNQGFTHVEGIDKFLPAAIDYGHGVKVQKKELGDLKAKYYDVLMLHHVLEHIDEQVETLIDCHRLLKDDGKLLIRIPIIGEAYKIYGEKWVQLDAPRHLVLHTLKSMELLAKKTGFVVKQVVFDSSSFQFLGSELYEKDISLYDPISHKPNDFVDFFSKDEIEKFDREADKLNELKTGDQAMFYLEKA